MAERFTDEWKVACLALLRAQREALKQSSGYKRMGWTAIRAAIMRPYDEYKNGVPYIPDERLTEKALDAWNRRGDASITDELFVFVDQYVRRLSMEGNAEALSLVQHAKFKTITKNLAELYLRQTGWNGSTSRQLGKAGWTLYSAQGAVGLRQIFLRSVGIYDDCIRVLYGNLPAAIDAIDPTMFSSIVFFEGLLLPTQYKQTFTYSGGQSSTTYLVKLFRPEFAGLRGLGYADGQLAIREKWSDEPKGDSETDIRLLPSNPVIEPEMYQDRDEPDGAENATMIERLAAAIGGLRGHQNVAERNKDSIFLEFNKEYDKVIDNIITKNYKGYIN